MTFHLLEFFSGLGGWRYAMEGFGTVVAAYDMSPGANRTYALNHGDHPQARELASIPMERLFAHGADTWVMSPPCQPFCRMGNQKGLEDRRSKAFLHLMEAFDARPPERLLLENVLGFQGSEAQAQLHALLRKHRHHWMEYTLCPTHFGIPNQRPRYFLVADRRPLPSRTPPRQPLCALQGFLDTKEDPSLYLPEAALEKHRPGLDLVTVEDLRSACFIGGYGQRFVGSGSFLVTPQGVRRFSPTEVARLLGYPSEFRFPEDLPLEAQYKLLGNGLSLPVARWVAEALIPATHEARL